MDINEVFKVYGNGNLSTSNIAASGGNIGGNIINASGLWAGSGSSGLGNNGYLYLNGEKLSAQYKDILTSISFDYRKSLYTDECEVDLSDFTILADASFSGPAIGTCSVNLKTGNGRCTIEQGDLPSVNVRISIPYYSKIKVYSPVYTLSGYWGYTSIPVVCGGADGPGGSNNWVRE